MCSLAPKSSCKCSLLYSARTALPSFVTFTLLTILHPALPLSYLAVKLPTVLAFLTHAEGKDWLGNVTERKRTLLRVGKFAPRSQLATRVWIRVIHKYVVPPSFFDL